MHEKSIHTLEYPKVLAKVANEASFSASKDMLLHLEPTSDLEEARRRLTYTSEALHLIDLQPDISVRGAHDIRPLLARAARDGVLASVDFVPVVTTLRSSIFVARVLTKLDPEHFPLLQRLGSDIPTRPQVVRHIEEAISDDGEVLDTASPTLRKLRFDIRGANQRLQERLRTLVHEFGSALQESIITTRSDRYVVPVKADFRGQVRGIVHDQSSSGATLFIEPMVIVEMNNRLRELQSEERQEIERILRVLSEELGREAETLQVAVELLAEFDTYLAKARYSRLMRCSEPKLNDQGLIHLYNARHPLLTGKVVPIEFRLGQDFFMIVVTGPNTGGKTVALKTVGLLSLMAQSGLHIPAEEGSEISVFEDIFADIGDEQSIEQSLSTFSSHMSQIITILRRIEELRKRKVPEISGARSEELVKSRSKKVNVLILFDELGAGTDPSEGSALARAILTFLLDRQISTVATTHYSELKAFAHEQKGVVNASVEFDVETLSPTYKLTIGLPGRSNALAISQRLGLDNRIVRGARRFLGNAGVRMENLLEDLQSERKGAEEERYHLNLERVEAEYQRKQLEEERHRLEEERIRILNDARAQARREIDSVLVELAKVRTEMGRGHVTRDRLTEMRQQTRGMEERVNPIAEPRRQRPMEEIEKVEGPLQIGDTVRVLSFGQNAELVGISVDRSEAEVQMGALRLRVNVDNIERISKRKATSNERKMDYRPNVILSDVAERPAIGIQLDMRGWRVEDALPELDTYLNDAALSGMSSVRILHGKGTGALRTAVREQLAHHPLVKSYAPAPPQEGGDGVTIVKISA
ncbi:MAG TPA: endonuclease MutS2 [Dictyobacter sp.]|jgi:DNA mismatch repair protein MutS2|nr:endonuclease MutS2 [Dictyobacter sp.]